MKSTTVKRTTLRNTAILIALSGGLIYSSFSCYTATHETAPVLPEGYPTREVIDTKKFDRLVFGDSLALVVASAYYAAFPNELGLCIYGNYSPSGTIIVVGLHADSAHTEEGQVRIFCEEEGDPPVIGSIHSHPGAANPAYPCTPSPQDYATLLTSDRGVMVIYCGNGSGVTVFRGGRQWNFAWR
ncbi:hypothetical protein LCGC14_2417300 [marine sediment metagenome]|uniref:JAB domain-containing protein n=1 Tax=marine sediment metagenome TaxID=412755 RepID=A0A0F9CCY5_9ZZZZ